MSSIIGFTLWRDLEFPNLQASLDAQLRALSYFRHLTHSTFVIGQARLEVWGHQELLEKIHFLPDGSLLVLIGSPQGKVNWLDLREKISSLVNLKDFELPWDGRAILLKISADGRHWIMWNDWLGSIPVFHTRSKHGQIVSTLEPVVVAGAGFTSTDFFLSGLVYLLIHGNFLGDWTLFKEMKIVPPDSMAEWGENGFNWKRCFTVKPTTERWEMGWDNLIDEMYELSRQAVTDVLRTHPTWILPLSSGLDSRFIAGVGAKLGVDIHTYTWGLPSSREVVCARQVADTLQLPWKWIDLGKDYLVHYAKQWADLFGSGMHFHGMYQMPFLDTLKCEPLGPIVTGFLGECLAGYDVNFQASFHSQSEVRFQSHPDGYLHWLVNEISPLLKVSSDEALDQISNEIKVQSNLVPGPWFQRLRFLTLWGRQHHFTYFQSALCDYWRGVATPYLNRAYARFCLSLPRVALDERRLQGDVIKRYFGKLAVIPGSYAREPYISTGRYLLKRRLESILQNIRLQEFVLDSEVSQLTTDVDCVRYRGRESFWPLFEMHTRLKDWFHFNQIEKAFDVACAGDMQAIRKLQSVQTIAYRLKSAGVD